MIDHKEMIISCFLISSTLTLTSLSLILFWLNITLLKLFSLPRFCNSDSMHLSVNRFCDKFNVITFSKYFHNFPKHSSVILFLINFTVLHFLPSRDYMI